MLFIATLLAAVLIGQDAAAAPQDARTPPGQTSPGQTSPAQAPATAVQDVEVTAQRRSAYEAARRFVDEVVETPPGRGLARWDGRVCVGVINMRPAVAQPLIDRISDRIAEIGLGVGEPGCTPNVMIVATDDGAAAARAMVQARPRAFNTGITGVNLTPRALQEFQESDAPVRWWRLTLPVDADTGEVTVRMPGQEPGTRAVRSPSRIRSQDRNVFVRIFVVLDVTRTDGVDFNALGDYLAMVSLAQIDADADVSGFSSILNLFDDPSATHAMSDWDLTYLRSLYAAELNERVASQQQGDVAARMANPRTDEPTTRH
ncbi:hypothetical protein BH09PSE1_BH09PSE1_29600 [soil metagenome]